MTRSKFTVSATLITAMVSVFATSIRAERQMETLDRGLVAVERDGRVYVAWRLLATDPDAIAFNVYRDRVRVNTEPIADATNIVDEAGEPASLYTVRPVSDGTESPPSAPARVWRHPYLSIALQTPA